MWRRLFSRKGASGFSSSSTAEEVTQGIDGTRLTAIVTGASGGIGAETTRVLAMRGVHVIMAVRNVAAGEGVKEAVVKEIPSTKVDVMELDLSSLASVRKFASDYNSLDLPLNLLINNAGIMDPNFKLSKDNIELNFATNHLGHFLLTNLLLDKMKKTTYESQREGRIIIVSSMGHQFVKEIPFSRINDQPLRYSEAYCRSKLANVLHAIELTRRLKEERVDITVNSLHPGLISDTHILRHSDIFKWWFELAKFMQKNVQQGAATTCYVALHPQVKGVSGEYFSDCNIYQASEMGRDLELAKKLWDYSMDLVKENQCNEDITLK